MNIASPLRYPGGKAAMSDFLRQVRRINRLADLPVVEPYAGGAGAALTLLFLEETTSIYINDADRAIHDFWWSLVKKPVAFLQLLATTRVNMTEWRKQRDIYRSKQPISRVRRGFAAFYLNRCNRSGIIIDGGPIGGVKQNGKWKLDARFNKADLRRRCEKVAEFRSRIHVSAVDGIDFIASTGAASAFMFVDPPYYEKGQTLYLNALNTKYHDRLASTLRSMPSTPWVLTYDDCPEVRRMYRGWATIRRYTLRYVAAERRMGAEVIVTPKWMRLPRAQTSGAMLWNM